MTDDLLLSTDLERRARYSQGGGIYRIVPAAVARPVDRADLVEVLASAAARNLTVTPRGAGSAMSGDNVTDGLILDLTGFDAGRCVIDADERLASVTPSLALGALNRAASFYQLQLPVDPSSGAWATLGGMTSTNASGPHTVRDGSVRPWIVALMLETSDGPLLLVRGHDPDPAHPVVQRLSRDLLPMLHRDQVVIGRHFPATRKNSAGYALDRYLASRDLIDLVIGSEGTLGVITDLTVRLAPIPQQRASLRVAVHTRADLTSVIATLRGFGPATVELLDSTFLRLVADQPLVPERPGLLRDAGGMLLLDFEGDDPAEVVGAAEAAGAAVRSAVLDVRVATDRNDIADLWRIRHGASPILAGLTDGRRSLQVIEDGCVPVERLGDYLDAVEKVAAVQRIDAVMFGHAGDGHVHVNLLPNLADADWQPRVRAIYAAVSDAIRALGGTPSGEHGAGRLRAGLMPALYGPVVMACFGALKSAFDPTHRFNPGVILGDGHDPLTRLKVGAAAAALPPGVDETLQRIEADARWAAPRWNATPR